MRPHLQYLLVFLCSIYYLKSVACSTAKTGNTSIGVEVLTSTQKLSYLHTAPRLEEQATPSWVVSRRTVNGRVITFRVVNGRQATVGEVPYQVSLRRQLKKRPVFVNFCGGSVITPNEVLSAAHCFKATNICDRCCSNSGRADKGKVKGVYAVAGTLYSASHFHGAEDSEENGQWRRVRTVRYPTSFNFPYDDIAIVFLIGSYTWTATVKPIPYAETSMRYQGNCRISGYGRMKHKHRTKQLLIADLRVLDAKSCTLIHLQDMKKMICTSDEVSDTGKGDSGGPLVCKNTGDPKEKDPAMGLLVGVVSGTKKGVKHGSYFTRVTSYVDFIEKTIREGATCLELSNKLMTTCAVINFLYWCLYL